MYDYKKLYSEIDAQEAEIQFDRFTNEDALSLGLLMVEEAKKQGKSVAIDISKNNQVLFHYSFEGTTPDNDGWIAGKKKIVGRFHKSSFYIALKLLEENKAMEEEYRLSSLEYIPAGGGFPLIIKGAGVVGTVTVSNLPQEDDHAFVVHSMRSYLKKG
jgi:uncharacterized protein (UPF0303 family)